MLNPATRNWPGRAHERRMHVIPCWLMDRKPPHNPVCEAS